MPPLNKINKISNERCEILTLDININKIEVAPRINAVDKFVRAIHKHIKPIHKKGINKVLLLLQR